MTRPAAFALCSLAALFTAPTAAQDAPAAPPLAEVLASQVGEWTGTLEYRDYQADRWFGLPMRVTVADGGDGVTMIRTADFDDGLRVGVVRITTVTMLGEDGSTEYSVGFRKGRVPEVSSARLTLAAWSDDAHWTILAEETATDDDRPALIRETIVRDGARLTTLKEVDFTDDDAAEWLVRNRSTLDRVDG
ncbi:hypothetical protein [Parerythrobacter lacustris]|uniref:DUF1579 domain-containing protein n=1 Tax=Parerythrobacter lacustris TaxID=2969984 RepID=A0ABT1XMJ8_9SPHN|nr:hypothetical protein [Parerythrobacter lacustris]MCR2832888.1 hypothetical protein [Parerythrobacter lacustris]